jgi:hypothetical protein
MTDHTFDHLARSLTGSRRSLLAGVLAVAIGWLGAPGVKAKKKPKTKPKPNRYGCLDVGDPCKRDGQCCSGICKGKPGKKRCRAHDTGTCPQRRPGLCDPHQPTVTPCNNETCVCLRTTADSNFCANANSVNCADCKKDADCLAEGFPKGTACVPMTGGECTNFCDETGMACMLPCGTELPDPPTE